MIDKYQKGIIKDLIISGDTLLHNLLDKYEKEGESKDLQGNILNSISCISDFILCLFFYQLFSKLTILPDVDLWTLTSSMALILTS